jgi:pyridoxal phosphate enzyme (YggS family)
MTDIAANIRRLRERIRIAAERSGRSPDSVRLIAVTKTVSPSRIQEAVDCGITDIGENRLQEALAKKESLADQKLTWHFIGRIQTNKAKKIAQNFDCVHSVDRLEVAEALARSGRSSLPVLIEVKLYDEPNKSGAAVSELPALVDAVRQMDALRLRGLMAIPPPVEDPEAARPFFQQLRSLARQFDLPELSMGMTHDFEVAVEEGATMVRVGTAIFGERDPAA